MKGWSTARSGCGMFSSTAVISSAIESRPTLGSRSSRAHNAEPRTIGNLVAGEVVVRQHFAHFEFDQIEKARMSTMSTVHVDDERGDAELPRKQNIARAFAASGHRRPTRRESRRPSAPRP